MTSTYKTYANDLDENLLNSIKLTYFNKNIQIIVTETNENQSISETELSKRIYEVENNINIVDFTTEEFDEFVTNLS
jgi:hypothetical protein